MKQDLVLNIGTKFDSEGMKKLNNAVKSTAQNVGNASRVIGSLSSELNQVTGKAGQAAGAIGGLFSAFAQGGMIAGITAAITTGIALIVSAFKSMKERAKEAADAFRESFSKSVDAIVTRIGAIKSALSFRQKENSIDQSFAAGQLGVQRRQAEIDIKNRYAPQKANAKTDLERAQIDAAEKRDLAISSARFNKLESSQKLADAEKNAQTLMDSYKEQSKEVDKLTQSLTEQRTSLESNPLSKKYDILKKAVEESAKTVREKGKDAVVGQKEIVTSTTTGNGLVVNQKRMVNVTAQEQLSEAVQALKGFKESDEGKGVIQDVEAYEKSFKEWVKQNEDLAKTSQQVTEADKAVIIAQKSNETAIDEYQTAIKAAEQQYKDDVKRAKDAAKQKADTDKKARDAEQKRIQEETRRKEIQDRRAVLQKKLDKTLEGQQKTAMQQLNEKRAEAAAAKELAEAERRAKEILDDWADNKKQDPTQWGAGQDAQGRQGQLDADRQRGNINKAKGQANNLAGQIFNAQGGVRGLASDEQVGKFAQLSDYLGGKNVSPEQRQALQDRAEKMRSKLFDSNGNLKVSRGSNALKNYRRIQGLLDKMKDIDKAKELDKQRKAEEERKARLQDEANKAVKDIRDQLKDLGM